MVTWARTSQITMFSLFLSLQKYYYQFLKIKILLRNFLFLLLLFFNIFGQFCLFQILNAISAPEDGSIYLQDYKGVLARPRALNAIHKYGTF